MKTTGAPVSSSKGAALRSRAGGEMEEDKLLKYGNLGIGPLDGEGVLAPQSWDSGP